MPLISGINTKRLKLTTICCLSPLFFIAQSLTGLWSGSLSNDSTTVRKDQSFEIALTEYKGKVYGYSCSEFIVNDTLFYIVKRVKGTITGDICEVTDDEIIAYNFRGKLDKGVKVTSTFRRNTTDSAWYLDGTWKTNVTKKYYAVTGKVGLKEEKDMAMSKLFPHLEELNLAKDVAFYNEKKEQPFMVRVAKPEQIKSEYTDKPQLASADIAIVPSKPEIQKTETEQALVSINKRGEDLTVNDPKNIPSTKVELTPASVNRSIAESKATVSINKQADISQQKTDTKKITTSPSDIAPAAVNKPVTVVKKPVAAPTTNNPVAGTQTNKPVKQPEIPVTKPQTNPVIVNTPVTQVKPDAIAVVERPRKTETELKQVAASIEGRKSEFSQVVNFKADSLELALYDNGEIDGDTVSVFMNGEVLMSKQGLRSSAIKKTIYITPGNEDFTLVLYADNLGKYPPNTGLLVVHDGEDVYNLRFSSDLQKSTGIVFRRK